MDHSTYREPGSESPAVEYTPTEFEVRARAVTGAALLIQRRDRVRIDEAEVTASLEFDRWLAAHDAEVAAKALIDARHLVIGTEGFQLFTDRAADIRNTASDLTSGRD